MNFLELIEARQSIRNYDGEKKPDRATIEKLLTETFEAPSWKNKHSARYYCIVSDEMIEQVKSECLPKFNAKNAEGAALIVTTFVKGECGFELDGKQTNEVGDGWGYYDLGLHDAYFVLSAKNKGLDTLIMGIRNADKLRDILNIPEEELIGPVIALGHASKTGKVIKKKTIQEVAKFY